MKLLIIDNYDSFTFNLKHMCETYVSSVNVVRNDEISINDISYFDKIIISPGPGLPLDAGSAVISLVSRLMITIGSAFADGLDYFKSDEESASMTYTM